jgi:hypothetical protein
MNRSQWKWLYSAVVALVLAPAAAFAQDTRVVVEDDEPDAVIQVGGGVNSFTTGLDDVTDPGAAWDVRAVFAPKNPIGMEGAYFGAMNDLEGTDNAALMTHGGEALLRANFGGDAGDVQPYLAAGLGVASQSVVDRDDLADTIDSEDFNNSTDILVPTAAGVDVYLADTITLGARLGYKFYFDDEVRADEDAADVQAWTATARLGAAF